MALPKIPKKLPKESADLIRETVRKSPKTGELIERLEAMPPELRRKTVAAIDNYISRTISELKRTQAGLRAFEITHIATLVDATLGVSDGDAVAKALRARTHDQIPPSAQEEESVALHDYIRSRPQLRRVLEERLERDEGELPRKRKPKPSS